MEFKIPVTRQLDEAIWKARLSPSEIQRFFDPKAENAGLFSILLLTENPAFDRDSHSLSFNPSNVKVLNVGRSDTAIVIGAATATAHIADPAKAPQTAAGAGDLKFLQSLPPNLKDLGEKLLREIRRHFPGDLVFHPSSGKYVEAPDNFWTIRPQPRDGSFRITVRGRPKAFTATGSLELKPDMGSYSSFKVRQSTEIEDLIRVLQQVRRR